MDGSQRRLAAILAADMVGFSRLIGADEEGTLARQKAIRVEMIDPMVQKHHGRIVKSTGDGFLAEFGSAVDAVRCALLIQSAMCDGEIATGDPAIAYRMGINVGDIVIDGDDIFGDGVNIAARIEGEANPGGICISRGAVDHVRGKVDAQFEDLGERLLKNIAEPIHLFRLLMAGRHPAPSGGSEKLPASPGYPTIVVLPIANISSSRDLDLLAVGLTEDFVAGLARVSELTVLPRNATDIFKGKAIDARQAARRLGVANVLEGNVQGSAKRLRVTVQLIDAVTGTYLWAGRYNNDGSEILALQDDIVRKVLTEVRVKLTVGDNARTDSGTQNLDAWLLCGEGFEEWFKFTREANVRAIELFQAAHRADPKWSRPFGGLAGAYRETAIRGWGTSPGKDLVQAEEFAQRSIDLDPSDPRGHMQLGQIRITTGRTEEGIALCEKAVDLAPNDFGSLGTLAWELPRVG